LTTVHKFEQYWKQKLNFVAKKDIFESLAGKLNSLKIPIKSAIDIHHKNGHLMTLSQINASKSANTSTLTNNLLDSHLFKASDTNKLFTCEYQLFLSLFSCFIDETPNNLLYGYVYVFLSVETIPISRIKHVMSVMDDFMLSGLLNSLKYACIKYNFTWERLLYDGI